MPGERDVLVEGMITLGKDCRWDRGPLGDSAVHGGM